MILVSPKELLATPTCVTSPGDYRSDFPYGIVEITPTRAWSLARSAARWMDRAIETLWVSTINSYLSSFGEMCAFLRLLKQQLSMAHIF